MFRRQKEKTQHTFRMDGLMRCKVRLLWFNFGSRFKSKDIPDASTDASSRRQWEEAPYQHVAEMMSRCEISPICKRKNSKMRNIGLQSRKFSAKETLGGT